MLPFVRFLEILTIERVVSMDEIQAIVYVLGGGHPGNTVSASPMFSPRKGDAKFKDFIDNHIPDNWHQFRYLCRLIYSSDL
jgi:hypothetical protein